MTGRILFLSLHRRLFARFARFVQSASAAGVVRILLVSCLLAPAAAQAQFGSPGGNDASSSAIGPETNPLQDQLTRFQGAEGMIPLEGPVDADQYIVGPGDIFEISIGGPQPLMAPASVSADGYLILPEAGAVEVGGHALREARNRAKEALQESFRNVRVEIALAQPRQFYVHVSGAVPFPGRYLATPVGRVAGVLSVAYADTTRAPTGNMRFRPALRNVRLIHTDGTQETVDLLRYHATGSTAHNPYLRDGDVVSVPAFDPDYGAVFISGNVAFPGIYDHRPDDTLSDVLALASGQETPGPAQRVRLSRVLEDGSAEAHIYDIAALADADIPVQARDQVHVLEEEVLRGVAEIDGWVHYPGAYPILSGETTLKDLMALAGGMRPGALARAAHLKRSPLLVPEPKYESRFGARVGLPDPVPADSLALLQSTRLADMDFFGNAYLAHDLQLQSSVPVDLAVALGEGAAPILLQDGDKVYVPRDNNQVFVFGQVNRPGYVPHQPGMTTDEYVRAANGLGGNAGSSYVIKAGTNRFVAASDATVESGDRIFVNRENMFGDTEQLQGLLTDAQRYDLETDRFRLEKRSQTFQTILTTVGTITGFITTYLLIQQQQ